MNKINKLKELYKNNKDKFLFDEESLNLAYDKIDDYSFTMVKAGDKNYIFIFKEINNEIEFKCLYKESNKELFDDYNNMINEFKKIGSEAFIDKYYNTLVMNYNLYDKEDAIY